MDFYISEIIDDGWAVKTDTGETVEDCLSENHAEDLYKELIHAEIDSVDAAQELAESLYSEDYNDSEDWMIENQYR